MASLCKLFSSNFGIGDRWLRQDDFDSYRHSSISLCISSNFQTVYVTAICSASGRATLSDARALLTREIQKIQKIRQGPCDAVVDTSIDEDGLYESSIARMSNSLSRRVDFGELDLPAHLSLLECRAFGLRQVCFSIVLSWLILALLHRFLLFVCAPESNFYLWMVNVILGCRRWVAEIYCRSTIPRLRSTRSLEGSMDSS